MHVEARRAMADLLRQIPYFASLEGAVADQLARQVRTRRYAPGETIVVEGWPCEGLSFVVQGHVRVYRSTSDGREQVLRVVGPGRTFNDAAAFDEGPNAESAIALDPATIGLVPGAGSEPSWTGIRKSPGRRRACWRHVSERSGRWSRTWRPAM